MKRRKRTMAAASVGLACLGTQQATAQTTLTGLTETNATVPADHGSFAPGTPNIALVWSDNWDQYDGWPNDPGDGVYQVDGDVHTIAFTPDAGWAASLTSFDLNVWAGGGETNVDWLLTGSASGDLGSGSIITADGAVTNNVIGISGALDETLTLTLTQTSGAGSYLAMDNLAFDQVVPEPSTLGLAVAGLGGLGALAMRRKR